MGTPSPVLSIWRHETKPVTCVPFVIQEPLIQINFNEAQIQDRSVLFVCMYVFLFPLLSTSYCSIFPAKIRHGVIFLKMVQKENFRAWICVSFQRKCSDEIIQPIQHHPVNFTAASKIVFAMIFTATNAKRDSKIMCTTTSNDQTPN